MCWVYTELHIGTLRSDNGGEYTSKYFEKYLQENGIKHQKTVPYNPQENGVAECMNQTLLNMVRSMIFSKMLYYYFGEKQFFVLST